MKHRPTRASGIDGIPADVRHWFAGLAAVTSAGWWALLPDEQPTLLGWWRRWRELHPGAWPPPDAPWIDWSEAGRR